MKSSSWWAEMSERESMKQTQLSSEWAPKIRRRVV